MPWAILPLLPVIAFAFGKDVLGLGNPVFCSSIIALLGMGVMCVASRTAYNATLCAGWIVIVACVGASTLSHGCPPSHWWRISLWSLTGCTAIAATAWAHRVADIVPKLAIGSSIALLAAGLGTAFTYHLGYRSTELYGFPNINVGINALGPFVLVGCTWKLIGAETIKQRIPWLLASLPVLGLSAMTGRRGILAASMAAIVAISVQSLWKRSRVRALLAVAAATVVLALLSQQALAHGAHSSFGLRSIYYRCGIDALVHPEMASGYGAFPSIHLMDYPWDTTRFLASHRTFAFHFHSEPLELILTGGPVVLLGLVLICIAVFRGIRSREDPHERQALTALSVMMLTLAAIDPSFSEPTGAIFLGIALGLASGSSTTARTRASRLNRMIGVALCLAMLAQIGSIFTIGRTSPIELQLSRCILLGDPESTFNTCRPLIALLKDPGERLRWTERLANRIGWVGPLVGDAEECAWESQDRQAIIEAELRSLARSPLHLLGYQRLTTALGKDPIPEATSPNVRIIHNLMTGRIIPGTTPPIPTDTKTAQMTVAALLSRHHHGAWCDLDDTCARATAEQWGALPDVANVLVQIGLYHSRSDWLNSCGPQLRYGLGDSRGIADLILHAPATALDGIRLGLLALWPDQEQQPAAIKAALEQRQPTRSPPTTVPPIVK